MRKRSIKLAFILVLAMRGVVVHAQASMDSLLSVPDTAVILSPDHFFQIILRHHPVAKQTELLSDVARQEIRMARGNFDPKLELQYLTKQFNDTEYYNILNGSVKFPSVLPFDPSIGVERNSGKYLNPERFISEQYNFQQFFAGISLPLGRGLITDERRTAWRQAELFGDMMEAEQIKAINKLMLEAAKDYWQWAYAYYNYRLFTQSVTIASEIFRRVKLNHDLGEAAPIDTVQAQITLQQRLVERQEALLQFQNTGIQLSNYLWDSLSNPLQLSLKYVPVLDRLATGVSQQELDELATQARQNHPEIRKIDVKLQQLDLERKLNAEFLKPKLDLNYYFLNQPFDPEWNTSFQLNENYKFGVDFAFPLLIRKERAKLAQTKIKISSARFERTFTERQILNQLNASFNEITNNRLIIQQQGAMVDNYNRILTAELLNLENGESDLFKINIQQEKLIQSQSKMIKLLSEFEKLRAFLYWAAGTRRLSE